jgi:hypothetical protein
MVRTHAIEKSGLIPEAATGWLSERGPLLLSPTLS